MINFTLKCKTCDHEFDAWFRSSEDYEKQKENKLINCPSCSSHEIDKHIMKPNVAKKSSSKIRIEWVGDEFANETIKIFKGEKPLRNIMGYVTDEDIEQMKEEGIKVIETTIPSDKKKLN